jgi:hypothetical protein
MSEGREKERGEKTRARSRLTDPTRVNVVSAVNVGGRPNSIPGDAFWTLRLFGGRIHVRPKMVE